MPFDPPMRMPSPAERWHIEEMQRRQAEAEWWASLTGEERDAIQRQRAEEARAARETEEQARAAAAAKRERAEESARLAHDEAQRAINERYSLEHRQAARRLYDTALAAANQPLPRKLASEHHFFAQWLVLALPVAVLALVFRSGALFIVGVLAIPSFFVAWAIYRELETRRRKRDADRAADYAAQFGCGAWPCSRCGKTGRVGE